MKAPALRISNIVYGRHNAGSRVRYLVDPKGLGEEYAVPEQVVMKRWRRRTHPEYVFGGSRLGPNLWRAVAVAFNECTYKLSELSVEQIEAAVSRAKNELDERQYRLPSSQALNHLFRGIGEARINKLLERHLSEQRQDRYGTPDLLLWALHKGSRELAYIRLVEVKKPREPVSSDQTEEIEFLRGIGTPARVLRLIERSP